MRRSISSTALALGAAALALTLAACSATPTEKSSAPQNGSGAVETEGWPRSIVHEAGTAEIPSKPLRIVSTSPSITGSLLAIGAPVVASAATTPSGMTDSQGFFSQWSEAATEHSVAVAYPNLSLDLDAIEGFEPDLIIGSANGGDSTLEAYEQLNAIAPTVLLDYGTPSWQDLTALLGESTGLEAEAAATVSEYDAWVLEQKKAINLPPQPATALVYMGADGAWTFTSGTPQGKLLASLGIEYADAAKEAVAPDKRGATGVAAVSAENMATGLAAAQTLFVVSMGAGDPVAQLSGDPLLANQSAVASDRVYSMGPVAFRLDYYSAKMTVQHLVDLFKN